MKLHRMSELNLKQHLLLMVRVSIDLFYKQGVTEILAVKPKVSEIHMATNGDILQYIQVTSTW